MVFLRFALRGESCTQAECALEPGCDNRHPGNFESYCVVCENETCAGVPWPFRHRSHARWAIKRVDFHHFKSKLSLIAPLEDGKSMENL